MSVLYPRFSAQKRVLVIAAECFRFAFINIENGQQFRNRQQILNFLRQIQKSQTTAFFVDGGVALNEFADAARINVADAAEIEQNFLFAFAEQTANRGAKRDAAFADCYLAIHIENCNIACLTFSYVKFSHFYLLF